MKFDNRIIRSDIPNWASEASPTLGCSIEISRDIYIFIPYCLSNSGGLSVIYPCFSADIALFSADIALFSADIALF